MQIINENLLTRGLKITENNFNVFWHINYWLGNNYEYIIRTEVTTIFRDFYRVLESLRIL